MTRQMRWVVLGLVIGLLFVAIVTVLWANGLWANFWDRL
jgi:hypothetical protein